MSRLREVVQSHRFDAELSAIEKDAKAVDQAAHAAIFALARYPGRGFPVPETPYFVWPVYIEGDEYVVYYAFDDHRVELISIFRSFVDDDTGS